MLKIKTKDELVVRLELEMRMQEMYWKKFKLGKPETHKENKQLYDQCRGRVDSLKFALGFDELKYDEKGYGTNEDQY